MNKLFIFGIIATVTTTAHAIPCRTIGVDRDRGYGIYRSSYIEGSTAPRCTSSQYIYFFNTSSSSTADSNLCPTELTRTLKLTQYIVDADNKSYANANSSLGNNNTPLYGFHTCNTCASGYYKTILATITDPDTNDSWAIYGCGKCQSDLEWTLDGSVESRKVCITIDGSPNTEYRCIDGFYGTGKNCTICPVLENGQTGPAFGKSDTGYNTNITDCYLEPGTYKDTTGTFKISSDCYYKK